MKTKALAGILVLALTVAVVVKVMFFPSIKDAYFAMDERSLQQAPAGLILVRPTQFPFLREKGILRTAYMGQGQAALASMLQSCSVVAVVNIDARFTAGAFAARIANNGSSGNGKLP